MNEKKFKKNIKIIEKNFFDMLPEFFNKGITFVDAKKETIQTIIIDKKFIHYLENNLNLKTEEEKIDYLFNKYF